MIYCKDHDFACWAFGKDAWQSWLVYDIDSLDLLAHYNALHGNELPITEHEDVLESMAKMKKLYEEKYDKAIPG